MLILEIECPFCRKIHYVEVAEEQYENYCAGALCQDAFPNLSATEREQIISGLCPECQAKIFDE